MKQDVTTSEIIEREYRAGFVTDIESETIPAGLSEDIVRLISTKKNEPAVAARLAAQGVPALAHDEGAELAERPLPADRLPGDRLLLRAQAAKKGPKSLDEVDPKLLETYEKLGIPLHERARLAGVAVDAVFDSVSVATTFKREARGGRHHLLLVLARRCRAIPSS